MQARSSQPESVESEDVEIRIHPLTKTPTNAWKEISKLQRVKKITLESPKGEVAPNKVRVVVMSDTHSATTNIKFDIPQGDIFIHAGDFTQLGRLKEVLEFNDWLGTLPHKHKIVIAGNHELSFDKDYKQSFIHTDCVDGIVMSDQLTNCTYIEDKLIEIYGIRIYGSPWQPEFGNWAFNLPRGQACLDKWNCIPRDIDILITHGPPLGHGDLCRSGIHAGCVELLTTIQNRVKPKYHLFGHVHEGYGCTTDGCIIFINASTCNMKYEPINAPIVFDIAIPPGVNKDMHT